jgi:flagellar basal-body rod modification protein FlgD
MSSVPPVGAPDSATGTGSADAAKQSADLNYNDFLQLLIAQMKNQDPTDPMDASQQISQLASFSQVEQQVQTNSHLETMMQNQFISQAANYVGKTITSADGTVTGVVKEVDIFSDGVVAVTDNNDKILIQAGVKVTADGTKPVDNSTDDGTDDGTKGTDGTDKT